MTLHPGRLIGEIAATIPGAIEALAGAGIDCCRDAELSIAQVSSRTGIRPGRIAALLHPRGEPQTVAIDWSAAPLAALTRYIAETLHPAEMSAIERISQQLATEQQDHLPDVTALRSAFAEVTNNLMIHMWREENEVFPFLEDLERAQGSAPPPARGAFPDPHDPILEALRRLRQITHHYTAPSLPSSLGPVLAELRAFDEVLHRHIHLENHVLYPRASALCACPIGGGGADWALTWF